MSRGNGLAVAAVIAMLLAFGTEPLLAQGTSPPPASGNPWNYAPLESAVGTLGAALGGIVGGLIDCALDRPAGCVLGVAVGALVGHIIGVLNGAVWGVKLVSSAYRVQGNIPLATLMALGGWFVLGQIPLPATGYIGAGIGATLGYNMGATIEARISLKTLRDRPVASSKPFGMALLAQ